MADTYVPPSLSGRVAVVTGASSGIGLYTALGLARAGAAVLLVCRNKERGEAAQAMIVRETGHSPELFLADFASLRAVDRVGGEIAERHPRLHILVNNAGIFVYQRERSVDGYEKTFAVNHLAPFHLTNRLAGALCAGSGGADAPARIVNVSSAASKAGKIDFDDLMAERKYGSVAAYAQSKLANILHVNELARRFSAANVTANSLHPGGVNTSIGDADTPPFFAALFKVVKPFLLTAEQGAINSLFVSAAPELATVTGAYFEKQKTVPPNPLAIDREIARRLWRESDALVQGAIR